MSGARKFAVLSIIAALVTIAMKAFAAWLTGSVGLFSDALEGLVNLVSASIAFALIGLAARPPDEDYAFGYSKAEYFSSGAEGLLILVAALAIGWAACERFLTPRPLEHVEEGLLVSVVASLVNFAVARQLFAAGRRYRSIALEADARHLMTDVWTSAGVVAGVAAVWVTGWERLDALIALAVAVNILWVGFRLTRRSAEGLLDHAWPQQQLEALSGVLDRYRAEGMDFHAVRTRQAGARLFVVLHVLVPATWTVAQGHKLAHQVEDDIRALVPGAGVFTHVEPLGFPESYQDMGLGDPEERNGVTR